MSKLTNSVRLRPTKNLQSDILWDLQATRELVQSRNSFMPPSSVTLHGGPFNDSRLCRIRPPQSGDGGGGCWLDVRPDVKRGFGGFGELLGGLRVVLLLLPGLEYISGGKLSAQPV